MADYTQDPFYLQCLKEVRQYIDDNSSKVFYSRQIEIYFEDKYFHWITNNAIRDLAKSGLILMQEENLSFGGSIKIYWHKSNRYYKTDRKKIINLVSKYSDHEVTSSLGDTGELLVIEAFTRNGFLLKATEENEYNGIKWTETNHNLDLILEKDGVLYGVEIKNTLSYMDREEFNIKIDMCNHLQILPLFVNRFFPATWAKVIQSNSGFALTMKYQLYPRGFKSLVEEIKKELGLPVGCPRRIEQGTINRVLKWHKKTLLM